MIKIDIFDYIVIDIIFQYNDDKALKFIVYFSLKKNSAKYNYKIYNKKN